MVRTGIRVTLGLQLVSSWFGVILCRLLYGSLFYVLKGSFYIAQYPVRWTAQSALHFCDIFASEINTLLL